MGFLRGATFYTERKTREKNFVCNFFLLKKKEEDEEEKKRNKKMAHISQWHWRRVSK